MLLVDFVEVGGLLRYDDTMRRRVIGINVITVSVVAFFAGSAVFGVPECEYVCRSAYMNPVSSQRKRETRRYRIVRMVVRYRNVRCVYVCLVLAIAKQC